MKIILLLLGAVLLYHLQAYFYRQKWTSGLSIDVHFSESAVNEGDTTSLVETVINRKLLPLTLLQIKFHVNNKLQFVNEENTIVTDNAYRNDIFSVMPYEKIQRKLPFVCTKRGCYQIHSLDLISFDLFLSEKSVHTEKFITTLYVYPKPIDRTILEVPFQKMMGTILTRRSLLEDPFEFRGIRPYQMQDSMKSINWKASAKTGEWKVNTRNYTASQQVTFLLDMHDNSNWEYTRLIETSIRIVASYAEELIVNGIPTRIVSNGLDAITGNDLHIPYGASSRHAIAIKEGLARIDEKKAVPSMLSYVENELANPEASSTLYILVSKIQNEEFLTAYNKLCTLSPDSQWIAPMHKDMIFLPERCPNAISYKWEVPYIE